MADWVVIGGIGGGVALLLLVIAIGLCCCGVCTCCGCCMCGSSKGDVIIQGNPQSQSQPQTVVVTSQPQVQPVQPQVSQISVANPAPAPTPMMYNPTPQYGRQLQQQHEPLQLQPGQFKDFLNDGKPSPSSPPAYYNSHIPMAYAGSHSQVQAQGRGPNGMVMYN